MEHTHFNPTFSFYNNLREKTNRPITLEQFVQLIRSSRYQSVIESYRAHLAQGNKAEAQRIKSNLPCVMVAGTCPGMHTDASIHNATDLVPVDIDGVTAPQADAVMELVQRLPYVVLAFRSPSNCVKIFVRLTHDGWGDRYRTLYALLAAVMGNELGHKPDMSSDNPSRLCFVSQDEDCYFNQAAQPFDWAGLELFPDRCAQLLAQADAWRKRATQPAPRGVAEAALFKETDNSPPAAYDPTRPSGYIFHTVSQFFHYNPWMQGQRNRLLMALGRRLKRKGFSQAEVDQCIDFVTLTYAEPDCTAAEIRAKINYGFGSAQPVAEGANLASQPHSLTRGHSVAIEKEEEPENVDDINEALRKAAPYFENKVFQSLPPILQRVLTFAYTDRERDMLLMATLTTLSAALPRVEFSYFNRMHAPPLYFLAIAPAGCGKGTVTLPPLMLRSTEGYLEGENQKVLAHYKQRLQEWELEKRRAQKEGRIPNPELEPMEPKRRQITMAPNTSKNQLIISLANNQPYALLTTSSELDMVTGAVGADCGGHDVVFRQAFHAESVGSHFKVDKEPIQVDKPSLALSLSGTPDQALKFLPSQENGLASRFFIYLSQSEPEFISGAPDEERKNLEGQFAQMAQAVLKNYLFLDKNPTEVKFTPAQWKRHREFFRKRLREVVADQKGDTTALVYRGAFIAMRIATILTALRKCEAQWEMHDVTCTDEDLETALSIADTGLHHNLLFSTMQAPPKVAVQAGSGIFRMKEVLRKMPTTFSFSDLVREAKEMGVPKASVERYLKKMVEMKLIVKQGDKYEKTGKFWPKKGL